MDTVHRADAGGDPCIVVGFDGLPAGVAALREAARLARALGVRLTVAHVVDAADAPCDPDGSDWERRVEAAVLEVRSAAEDTLAGDGLRWRFAVLGGDPATALAQTADVEDAAMIVLGAPRTGLASAMERLLGEAVATRLLRHGRRPVLVVPEQADEH